MSGNLSDTSARTQARHLLLPPFPQGRRRSGPAPRDGESKHEVKSQVLQGVPKLLLSANGWGGARDMPGSDSSEWERIAGLPQSLMSFPGDNFTRAPENGPGGAADACMSARSGRPETRYRAPPVSNEGDESHAMRVSGSPETSEHGSRAIIRAQCRARAGLRPA
jgi:hypothetical protein